MLRKDDKSPTPEPGWDLSFFAKRDIVETTSKPEQGMWVRKFSCPLPESDGHVERSSLFAR